MNTRLIVTLRLSGQQKSVWLVGSSIIKHAFVHARKSVDGVNLGLERIKSTIWWQGKSGMRICEIIPKVKHLLTLEEPPQVLVFHCGGNDIGQNVSCVLGHDILKVIDCLRVLLPKSKFVWSQILPRLKYRNEIVHRSLNRTRVRLNSLVATYIIKHGGAYIRYPEISEDNPDLFLDGVHLSDIGNNLFLYRLQQGLFDIIKFSHTICPQNGEVGPWLRESVSL